MKRQFLYLVAIPFVACFFLACGSSNSLSSSTKEVNQGYGTQAESNRTTSISQTDVDKVNAGSISWIELFQRTPGVSVSGAGDNLNLTIRGKKSMNHSNFEPLFVVNSQIMGNGFDRVAFIDPTMVDKISVLKDAASASAYGSRGADGVIIITLKN